MSKSYNDCLSTRIRHGNATPKEEALADAAPQLLEACKAILASFHESVRTEKAIDEFPALKAVDAAIRAAEGGGV